MPNFHYRFSEVASVSWVLPGAALESRTQAWSFVAGALQVWGWEKGTPNSVIEDSCTHKQIMNKVLDFIR